MCTISAKSRSVESVVELAGELEVDGVEIWGKDHLGSGTPERCREIASVAAASGVAIPVYGSYLRPGSDDFDETLDRDLTVADELGSDLIRVWAGEQEYQDCDDAYFERVVRDLERLAEAAEEKGLGVTVECHVGM